MHIRIFMLVGVREPINHLLRLLRRGRVIQIDERLAVRPLGEDREIRADRLDVIGVERGLDDIVHAFASALRISASRPRPEPGGEPGAQGVDQEFVLDAVDRLLPRTLREASPWRRSPGCRATANKTPVRDRARHRRAMSADNIVGEDLELGLFVHLRPRRQQNGLRLHCSVGLLRRSLDDDLALKDANRVVVDDRAIEFSARPAQGGVNDLQRRVRAPVAIDKRQSAERDLGALARRSSQKSAAASGRRPRRGRRRQARRRPANSQTWVSIWSPGSSPTTATCLALAPLANVMIVAVWRCTPRRAPSNTSTNEACAPASRAMAERE